MAALVTLRLKLKRNIRSFVKSTARWILQTFNHKREVNLVDECDDVAFVLEGQGLGGEPIWGRCSRGEHISRWVEYVAAAGAPPASDNGGVEEQITASKLPDGGTFIIAELKCQPPKHEPWFTCFWISWHHALYFMLILMISHPFNFDLTIYVLLCGGCWCTAINFSGISAAFLPPSTWFHSPTVVLTVISGVFRCFMSISIMILR